MMLFLFASTPKLLTSSPKLRFFSCKPLSPSSSPNQDFQMIVGHNLENKIISLQSLCVYLLRFQNCVELCRKIGSVWTHQSTFHHLSRSFTIRQCEASSKAYRSQQQKLALGTKKRALLCRKPWNGHQRGV
ncbi:hypothetical protein L1987_25491 [Smallanthus sonchifolius]|uniref:Uncharacterized protein n=1 Tax=Smallanthus sonchifolius TaxID=185202 RepID=A0ACB9IMM2_9ASTR|nr:hypothetical protein L1987_25491 [Smallanthus sonchifolius]